jgi:hypothetical protein
LRGNVAEDLKRLVYRGERNGKVEEGREAGREKVGGREREG